MGKIVAKGGLGFAIVYLSLLLVVVNVVMPTEKA